MEQSKGVYFRAPRVIQDILGSTQDAQGFIRINSCSVTASGDNKLLGAINMTRGH